MKLLHTLLGIFTFSVLSFLFASSTSAHVLKTDGDIGAVLHVSPEDDPIINEPSSFFFELKDKSDKFKPENCDCRGIILQDGKQLYVTPLFQNNTNPRLTDASFSFTFAQKGIYTVIIQGKPINQGSFEPFTLTWELRVERETTNKQPSTSSNPLSSWFSDNLLRLLGVISILLIPIIYIVRHLNRKKNHKPHEKKGGEV